jgi:hypothetical protein
LNGENQTVTVWDEEKNICFAQLSGAERGKISISPMPGALYNQ